MPMIQISKYHPHANQDFAGNPLIEVLPPMDLDTVSDLITVLPAFHPDERTHSNSERLHYLLRLSRYYVPLDRQLNDIWALWCLVLEGYRVRNPTRKETKEEFQNLCAQIINKTVFIDNGAFHTSTLSASRIGISGIGKTVSCRRLFDRLPQTLLHHPKYQTYQLLSLWIDCPDTDGYMSMLKEIARKLHEHCDEHGLIYTRLPSNPTRGALENQIVLLAKLLNLGILFIDEIQHAVTGNNHLDEKVMSFMTGFVNRLKIPVVAIGTWEALQILGSDFRMLRRSVGLGSSLCYRLKEDEEWQAFVTGIFQYQWICNPVKDLTPELISRFYYHTQGIIDAAIKLMQLSQLVAIQNGSETITVDLLDEVADTHLALIAPVVRQLREGRKETDAVFWDIDPVDFEEHFLAMVARANLAVMKSAPKPSSNETTLLQQLKEVQISTALMAAGLANNNEADALAKSALAKDPNSSSPQIIAKTINGLNVKGPRPTKSVKRDAAVEAEFNTLEENDLRRIAYFSAKAKMPVADALFQRDLLVNVEYELEL